MGNHVLLIEDEPNIREAVRFILSRDGWEVDVHGDGRTAMETIASLKPDAIILDVMLPNRSGFEILEDLRADPEIGAIPVLLLTARGQMKDREMAAQVGASDFMTKPFANEEVVRRVRALLDTREEV